MASAAAWSLEEGVGAPTVCQADFLALRNSVLAALTVVEALEIAMYLPVWRRIRRTCQGSIIINVGGTVVVPAQSVVVGDNESRAGAILTFSLFGLSLWLCIRCEVVLCKVVGE